MWILRALADVEQRDEWREESPFYNVHFRKALLRELQQQGICNAAEHATWLDNPKDPLRNYKINRIPRAGN